METANMKAEILELVNADPFQHFAIITTAGAKYDITDPNGLAVARDKLHYYFPHSDRRIHVPYGQIATIEVVPGTKPRR
jgi:hypothetical protein